MPFFADYATQLICFLIPVSDKSLPPPDGIVSIPFLAPIKIHCDIFTLLDSMISPQFDATAAGVFLQIEVLSNFITDPSGPANVLKLVDEFARKILSYDISIFKGFYWSSGPVRRPTIIRGGLPSDLPLTVSDERRERWNAFPHHLQNLLEYSSDPCSFREITMTTDDVSITSSIISITSIFTFFCSQFLLI